MIKCTANCSQSNQTGWFDKLNANIASELAYVSTREVQVKDTHTSNNFLNCVVPLFFLAHATLWSCNLSPLFDVIKPLESTIQNCDLAFSTVTFPAREIWSMSC